MCFVNVAKHKANFKFFCVSDTFAIVYYRVAAICNLLVFFMVCFQMKRRQIGQTPHSPLQPISLLDQRWPYHITPLRPSQDQAQPLPYQLAARNRIRKKWRAVGLKPYLISYPLAPHRQALLSMCPLPWPHIQRKSRAVGHTLQLPLLSAPHLGQRSSLPILPPPPPHSQAILSPCLQ